MDDLQWQVANLGGVLPRIVDEVLDGGGLEALVGAAEERGDWFCAEGAVRGLCAAGEFGRAWAVVEPFVGTGWRPAVRVGADVLVRWGRIEQALELSRPAGSEGTEDAAAAARDHAEVLVRAGRADEAVDLLAPHLRDRRVLGALVELTEGQGCDERVLELLAPLAEEFRRSPVRGGGGPWEVLSGQARVLERSGRADEAIRQFGADVAARRYGPLNNVESYAELLARHGRIEELRSLAGTESRAAVPVYVRALEDAGRAGEAEAYLRGLIAAGKPGWYESMLMELLFRQGRPADGIEAAAGTFDDLHDANLLQPALLLLAEHGLHDRAIALTQERSPEFLAEHEAHWVRSNRWWLMGEAGRAPEALAEIAALPVDGDGEADEVDDRELTVAWLLAQDGRVAEADALLRGMPGKRAGTQLAELLIRQGRFAEAIAAIPGVAAQREEEERRRAKWREAAASGAAGGWGSR
ncbi:tetratricopeptide repeat protein [Kitasatospora cineracea]